MASLLLWYGNRLPSSQWQSFESGTGEGKTYRWLVTRRNFAKPCCISDESGSMLFWGQADGEVNHWIRTKHRKSISRAMDLNLCQRPLRLTKSARKSWPTLQFYLCWRGSWPGALSHFDTFCNFAVSCFSWVCAFVEMWVWHSEIVVFLPPLFNLEWMEDVDLPWTSQAAQ